MLTNSETRREIIVAFDKLAKNIDDITNLCGYPKKLSKCWFEVVEYLVDCGDCFVTGEDIKSAIVDTIFESGEEFFENFTKHKALFDRKREHDFYLLSAVEQLERYRVYFGDIKKRGFEDLSIFEIASTLREVARYIRYFFLPLAKDAKRFDEEFIKKEFAKPFDKIHSKELVSSFFDGINNLQKTDFEQKRQLFTTKLAEHQTFVDYNPFFVSKFNLQFNYIIFLKNKWEEEGEEFILPMRICQ